MAIEIKVWGEESSNDPDGENDEADEEKSLGGIDKVVDGGEVVKEPAGELFLFK